MTENGKILIFSQHVLLSDDQSEKESDYDVLMTFFSSLRNMNHSPKLSLWYMGFMSAYLLDRNQPKEGTMLFTREDMPF